LLTFAALAPPYQSERFWLPLDYLHVLFESSGNDPEGQALVLDAVEELKSAGLIESRGGDSYSLTKNGKSEVAKLETIPSAS
jgi:hypothetical protein